MFSSSRELSDAAGQTRLRQEFDVVERGDALDGHAIVTSQREFRRDAADPRGHGHRQHPGQDWDGPSAGQDEIGPAFRVDVLAPPDLRATHHHHFSHGSSWIDCLKETHARAISSSVSGTSVYARMYSSSISVRRSSLRTYSTAARMPSARESRLKRMTIQSRSWS